jgi:hypothetical protein
MWLRDDVTIDWPCSGEARRIILITTGLLDVDELAGHYYDNY